VILLQKTDAKIGTRHVTNIMLGISQQPRQQRTLQQIDFKHTRGSPYYLGSLHRSKETVW
jgi:hypothetical protein